MEQEAWQVILLSSIKRFERMKKDLTEIYVQHNSKGKTYAEFEAGMDRDNFLSAHEASNGALRTKLYR